MQWEAGKINTVEDRDTQLAMHIAVADGGLPKDENVYVAAGKVLGTYLRPAVLWRRYMEQAASLGENLRICRQSNETGSGTCCQKSEIS